MIMKLTDGRSLQYKVGILSDFLFINKHESLLSASLLVMTCNKHEHLNAITIAVYFGAHNQYNLIQLEIEKHSSPLIFDFRLLLPTNCTTRVKHEYVSTFI